MSKSMTTTSKSERLTTVLYVTNSLLPLKPELPSRVAYAVCCLANEGENIAAIIMTRAASTVRIDVYPGGVQTPYRMTTDREGGHKHDIAHLLGELGLDRVTARSLAFDAAIILDCALDQAQIDNYYARRAFPLREALATNNFKN